MAAKENSQFFYAALTSLCLFTYVVKRSSEKALGNAVQCWVRISSLLVTVLRRIMRKLTHSEKESRKFSKSLFLFKHAVTRYYSKLIARGSWVSREGVIPRAAGRHNCSLGCYAGP